MAERKISTRFKIEGEAEYKNAVKGINNELKTLSSEMAKTQSEFQTQANSYEALAKKGEVLAKQQEAQARKVAEMRDALENSRAAHEQYGAALEEQKASVEALRERLEALKDTEGDTSAEQEKLTAELEKAERAQSAAQRAYDESGKSVDYWQRSLNYAERDLNNLDAEIQKNNQYLSEAQKSADGCATSIDKYGKAAGQAGENTGLLGEIGAAALGKLSGLISGAGLVGFAIKLLDTIKDIAVETNNAQSIMVQGTGASTEALQELNVAYQRVMATAMTSSEVVASSIAALSTRLGLTGDELVRDAQLFEQFGRATGTDAAQGVNSVVDMLNAFGAGAKDIPRVLDLLTAASQSSGASVLSLAQSVADSAFYAREYGYSLEQTVALMAAAEQAQSGLSSTLSRGMKKAYDDVSSSGKTFNQIMQELRDGTLGAQDAVDLFGQKGVNVAQFIRNGTLDIEAMTKAMEGADGRMVRTAKDAETFGQKIQGFWNAVIHSEATGTGQVAGMGKIVTQQMEEVEEAAMEASRSFIDIGAELYDMIDGFDGTSDAIGRMIAFLQDGDGQVFESIGGYETFLGTLKNLQRGYEDLEAEQEKVRAAVNQTVEQLTANFNDLSGMTARDVNDMIKSLKSQEAYMVQYAANMQTAANRGVNEGLLKTLQDGSVQSAEILAGLATATDEQIDELNAQWEKTEEGKETFEETLTEMQGEFSKKAAELEDRYRQTVDSFNRESEAAAAGAKTLQGVLRGAASMASQVNATMYNYGRQAYDSYMAGFSNGGMPGGGVGANPTAPTFEGSVGQSGQGLYPDVIGAIDGVTDAVNNQTPIAWDTFQQNMDLGLGQGAKMNRLAGG